MPIVVQSRAVALSFGGTNTYVSAGDLEGNVLQKVQFASKDFNGPEDAFAKLRPVIRTMRARYSAEAFGIAIGAPFDPKTGLVGRSSALPSWEGINVYSLFGRGLGFAKGRTHALNDAKAFAISQHYYGPAADTGTFIGLTFGTGMGGGLLNKGRLVTGTVGCAGEVGHIPVPYPKGFEKLRTFEDYCCGPGIVRVFRIARKEYEHLSTILHPNADAKAIFDAYYEGDPLAKKVIHVVREAFGFGVAALLTTLNPDKVVAGAIYSRHPEALNPAKTAAFRLLARRNPTPLDAIVLPTTREEDTSSLQPLAIVRFSHSDDDLFGDLRMPTQVLAV